MHILHGGPCSALAAHVRSQWIGRDNTMHTSITSSSLFPDPASSAVGKCGVLEDNFTQS